jgi:dipeptidyl-peptidase-3
MQDQKKFNYLVDQFEDMRVLKYRLPGFEALTLKQKQLIYFLSQAALSGRDILWDQNFRYNLLIRKTIEAIIVHYSGKRDSDEYKTFLVYAKRVFFTNGIHHHYSTDKLKPGFSVNYFALLITGTDQRFLPLAKGQTPDQLISFLAPVIFDEKLFARKVELKAGVDIITGSSINKYENVNQKEVEAFYSDKTDPLDAHPVSVGLNTRVVRYDGLITEEVYKSGSLYGRVIDQIIFWLEKAIVVAETEKQKDGIKLLIKFYKSGDLRTWDEFNVL